MATNVCPEPTSSYTRLGNKLSPQLSKIAASCGLRREVQPDFGPLPSRSRPWVPPTVASPSPESTTGLALDRPPLFGLGLPFPYCPAASPRIASAPFFTLGRELTFSLTAYLPFIVIDEERCIANVVRTFPSLSVRPASSKVAEPRRTAQAPASFVSASTAAFNRWQGGAVTSLPFGIVMFVSFTRSVLEPSSAPLLR